jgi:choline dehydrogenase-like flavoprotein
MLLDLNDLEAETTLKAPICIVGGGAVGLAMAARLARSGQRVIVVEAGGASLEVASQRLMAGRSVGHPFGNIDVGRYRCLGGSTLFWGGQVLPVSDAAIDGRPWLDEPGWPVARQSLDPYFAEAYDLIGLARAERDDARIWSRLGHDPHLSADAEIVLTRWVPQRNFSRLFRDDIDRNASLTVVVHANVTAISREGGRITALEARSLSGRRLRVEANAVVLACGCLEIARLLLHPAADGSPQPWSANPWLGRGFMDHLHGPVASVELIDYAAFHDVFDCIFLDGFKFYPRIRLGPAAQAAQRALDISGEFQFSTDFSQHLDNIKMFVRSLSDGRLPDGLHRLPAHIFSVSRIAAPLAWRYLSQRRSFKPRDAAVSLVVSSEQIAAPDSAIRLDGEVDAVGMRKIVVDWRIDGRELTSLKLFAGRVGEALAARGLARLTMDPRLENEDPAFLDSLTDGIHQMGATRMGRDAASGVVDSDLRVFGTDNLFVAGQAVFPSAGFANPTFTGIAFGLRLCDHLKGLAA